MSKHGDWSPEAEDVVQEKQRRDQRPVASVIIPTFNRPEILKRAIQSVLAQKFTDFELIIVNDGGAESTETAVAEYKDSRIRLLSRPNGGISAARNTGIANAQGKWITFLDDDDEVFPEWLMAFQDLFSFPDVGIACVGAIVKRTRNGSTEIKLPRRLRPVYESAHGLFMAGTFAARSDILHDSGGFAEGLQCSHATELAMRLIPACHRKGFVVKSCERAYVQINRQDPDTRSLRRPAHLLEGTDYILRTHRNILRRSPSSVSRYLAIAGVAAVRLGRYGECRKLFFKSLLAHPWSLKPYLRFLASLNPYVARRVWAFSDLNTDGV